MIYQCCDKQKLVKNGKRNGYQNYICTNCKKQMNDSPNFPYRPTIGDKSMTNAERQAKFRNKKAKKT
jgi:transposase-like protein